MIKESQIFQLKLLGYTICGVLTIDPSSQTLTKILSVTVRVLNA